jgi:hypothetical protein
LKRVISRSKAKDQRSRASSVNSSPANCRNTSSERGLSVPRTGKERCYVEDNTDHLRKQRVWPLRRVTAMPTIRHGPST